ncbi:D-sedoheptulose 7-phosphate isomerase [Helicobacter canadensis]|uniref:Phosphoheptose isomerase n=1 Tax=Helicobacter canadensis MIT 98-5491 TaxID=537970 RepID=C5ZV83_9HELI|nr:D-sedoheptulose 7-phosphate isomerase [Helicobacter canadensis]EES88748.1 phosphoheptose isomerase [Helicobacter canadensis MIT 98-5491]EFR48960.1 phosphoheptose isomerase [Helicobacter canadensis MIT 98-5491]STP00013.1 phosphoheptose isomerase [Helicobacter canadensis]
MQAHILNEIQSHLQTAQKMSSLVDSIQEAANLAITTLQNGGKILICGNGGSAADSQHIAAELTGRYKRERKGLSAIALTTDTSALTAIGNDYGYDFVFSRQFEALAKKGDLLWGISTSGNSINVLNAMRSAREMECKILGFSGKDGGEMKKWCDLLLLSPSDDTPRIQEMHLLMAHIICDLIEKMTMKA